MNFGRAIVDRLQRAAARSSSAVSLAAKLRNQCNRVIAYSVCESPRPESNGEAWLLESVGDQIETVFDVGANRGDWADLALKLLPKMRRGVLFEPGSDTFAHLQERFSGDDRIELVQAAVTNCVGCVDFFESKASSEGSSIWTLPDQEMGRRYEVAATNVDNELSRLGIQSLDLLKIDTEGNDFHVLEGTESAFRRGSVQLVQFEYGPNWMTAGSTLRRAIDYLASFGYAIFSLKPDSLRKVSPSRIGEYFGYSNFVAVSKPFLPVLGPRVR